MKPDSFLFDLLKENFEKYSNSQKVLARAILTKYQKVAFLTIKEFAEFTGVSEATIVRFVKLINFGGYLDFQKEIRRILRADLRGQERFKITYSTEKEDKDTISDIIEKEIDNFLYLQKVIDPNNIKKAVSAIRNASEVLVVGTRASASLACHLSFGLSKLEIRTTKILTVSSELFDLLNKLGSNSLVIVIGFPRYVNELLNVLEFCKENKIKTIAVTDSPYSPLVSDINLYSPAESTSFIAFISAPLVLINSVIIELSMMNKNATLSALSKFDKLAEAKKYFAKR